MGEAAIGWLVLGVALHLANQVLRGRGWWALVRAAHGEGPRRRDAIAAWVAGAGAGGPASARGGGAVRVLLLRRRMPGAVGPQLGASTATVVIVAAALVLGALLLAAARRSPRVRRIAAGVGRGCAPLTAPGDYARRVLPWQLASRACRLGALACFLAAFGIPATPIAVLLVAFAQGGSRMLPFAPASVGAGVALLAASFGPVTRSPASADRLAAFYVGTSTLLTVVGTALALAICLRDQTLANAGRSVVAAVAGTGRRVLAP